MEYNNVKDPYSEFLSLKKFLINSNKTYDIDLITRAFEYASGLHEGQYRKSGEEYIIHPIAVAQICANLGYGTDCVCAAILHDVVEDCPDFTSMSEIYDLFGQSIGSIVDGLTKLKGVRFMTKEEENTQNIRKMFVAMSKEPRVMFVKLCDRLHNMRTLSAMPPDKQRRIALETMHVFAPVAYRMGIKKIKAELDDLSLQYLDPIGYAQIKENIELRFGESRDIIEKCQEQIKARLSLDNISFIEEGRVKSVNSIYQKILAKGKSFDEISDFYAIRYIVNTLGEVYHVLSIVHDLFPYIQDRFKDYISTPKPNNYQSIHTTVICEKIPIEVQIRTKEMHDTAEFGLAAHWQYKSGDETPEDMFKKLKWVQDMVEADDDAIMDSDEMIENLKDVFYADDIFVYTPKGDIKFLRKGSTVIDFAYAIHSAIGNKTVGARINGAMMPIDTVLESSQRIEVLTSNASRGPSRDWLEIVKTSEAKNKIKQWFKREKRTENILIGREEIEIIFKKLNRPLTEDQRAAVLTNISKREGFSIVDDFYNAIGYGGLATSKLYYKVKDETDKILKDDPEFDMAKVVLDPPPKYSDSSEVIIDGMDNFDIKFAKCCNPVRGDKIYGFITKGHGMSVHRADCKNFLNLKSREDSESRVFTAFWNENKAAAAEERSRHGFKTQIKISAVNDDDLMHRIFETIRDMRVPLHGLNEVRATPDGNVIIDLLVSTRDVDHVKYILGRLKTIKNVKDAARSVEDFAVR
jgi:GTP pyrophosphokinase